MTRILHLMAKSLGTNLKTLIYFEILYRLFGVLLLYPTISRLFDLSIEWSPFVYITNKDLVPYLLSPMTLLMIGSILFLVSIYFLVEILLLQTLYDYSIKQVPVSFKQFWTIGLNHLKLMFRRKPFYLWIPVLCFVYIIGFISIYGFISSIELPIIINELRVDELINRIVMVFTVCLFVLFIETMLFFPLYGLEMKGFMALNRQKQALLKKRRIRTMTEFLSLNLLMNVIVYGLYFVILLSIGWLIQLTRGEGYVVSTLFALIYALYALIGLLSTVFLVPINVAYITAVYYHKHTEIETPSTFNLEDLKPNPVVTRWGTRLSIVIFTLLVIFNISTVYQIVGADRSPIELLNRSSVIAHRGASTYIPENTLLAMEAAMSQGADAVEIDVRMSKDGIPFLFHDTTVNRTTNLTTGKFIEDLTFEEIRQLDAGSWFHPNFAGLQIPSLVEVLELVYGKVDLYLEIKGRNPGIEERVMDLLIDYDMIDSTTLMSFSRDQLRRVKELEPIIQTMLLVPVFFGSLNDVLALDYIDSYGLRFDMMKANPEYITMIHNKGKRVYGWTINRRADIKQAVAYDVDGIITDDPLLALELVYEKVTPTLLQDLIRQLFRRT